MMRAKTSSVVKTLAWNKQAKNPTAENLLEAPSSEEFPQFLIATCDHLNDATFHATQSCLAQISDRIVWPSPSLAIADLRGMQGYFKTATQLIESLLQANQTVQRVYNVRFFLGQNLLHSVIFLNNETNGNFHSIHSQNLQFRRMMKSLTWEQWLAGSLRFLGLYAHTKSTFEKRATQLSFFAKTMSALRASTPYSCMHAADLAWNNQDELTRRFGNFVSFFWNLFRFPFDWNACPPLAMKQVDTPIDLRIYRTNQQETEEFENAHAILFPGLIPALLACLRICLLKIQRHNPIVPLGILDFKVSLALNSGLRIERKISLNEGLFCLSRSTETMLTEIFSHFFSSPKKKSRNGFHAADPAAKKEKTTAVCAQPAHKGGFDDAYRHQPARLFRQGRPDGAEGKEKTTAVCAQPAHKGGFDDAYRHQPGWTWECVDTPEGIALFRHDEPSLAYLVSHIENIVVEPLRLCEKTLPLIEKQLFADESSNKENVEIARLRKELFALTGHDSLHCVPTCSFRRPYAWQPLCSTDPEPHFSNLFSHAFEFRPPAVLRRPLPFLLNLQQASESHHLVFLESIAGYEFFLYFRDNSNEALWLCSALSQDKGYAPSFHCLGYYESLDLLPDWLTPRRRKQ